MMVKDDEYIEVSGKHDYDSGNNIEELDSKAPDAKNEINGEILSCEVIGTGGGNESEDAGQCLNELNKEAKYNISLNNEMEDQTNPQTETNEPMTFEGSTGEQINTNTNVEEQIVNEQTDASDEVVEQNASIGVVNVKKPVENGVESEHSEKNMIEEKNDENGVESEHSEKNMIEEKNDENGVERENLVKNSVHEKIVENGMEGDTLVKNVIEEKIAENGVEGENLLKNMIAEKNTENGVEGENLVKYMVVEQNDENGVEGESPLENGMEENKGVGFSAKKHNDCERTNQDTDIESDPKKSKVHTDLASNEAPSSQNATLDKVLPGGDEEMEDAANNNVNEAKEVNDEAKEQGKEILVASPVTVPNAQTIETVTKHEGDHSSLSIKHEVATPSVRYLPVNFGEHSGGTVKTVFTQASLPLMAEGDDGTPEDQAAFMKEIENFYREKAMDFKPPKFYGHPLNCLKLWRAVIRLGGYDRVTGSKLWRQVGESFHPPKTCTTVSWTFRIFYEKSLLEYERHKTQNGELQLPVAGFHEASAADTEGIGHQGSGPGRARRDSAARAMQGWHGQRLFANGEVPDSVIKDKSISGIAKRDKNVKTIGSLKQKRPNEAEHSVKSARIETSTQLATTVVDIGLPADWVKVNVRQMKDCFEVYALVPGLLREEVRVQSDPAGRLVITGQPEQVDNPWGITPFKKVVNLPSRIDPLQTSAVVSLHGRLFVRVPFEQSNE
ncbi:hypothetical protein CASFOL_014816 [Castilleja foliolosa]|uniref:AT-rich interactive domain-containing protein 5 n=1 Tax=Castilleja foliolosa TaxID=1961234 RepID=A0ABD3DCD0_9LAMI